MSSRTSTVVGTVTVRGEGAHAWAEDVHELGTVRRELFDSMLAAGTLTLVDDPDGILAEPEPDPEPELEVPTGNIDDVLAWVRQDDDDDEPAEGWLDRAQLALVAELASAKPRTTLVDLLEQVTDPDPQADPADTPKD